MNGPPSSNILLFKAKQVLRITTSQCESALQHYALARSLSKTKQLHALSTTLGLLPAPKLASNFGSTYALCGSIPHARKMLDVLSSPTSYLYNSMLKAYINEGSFYDTATLFVEMLRSGRCLPDGFTYLCAFKACGELPLVKMGVSVHGRMFRDGFGSNVFVMNSLLAMYMNWGEKEEATRIFRGMQERSVVSWNAMISGCFQNGFPQESLMVFHEMSDAGVEIDSATVVSVLPACGYLMKLDVGRGIHAMVKEKGDLWKKIAVKNALVDMYVKCGSMDKAGEIFDEMGERDVVTWTTMINGYLLNNDASTAIMLCRDMQLESILPSRVTLASLLSACGSLSYLKYGCCFHGWALRRGFESELIVETALIDMYAKCNHFNFSLRVFMKTSKKRTTPWNAILSGCIHNRLERKAIELFKEMLMGEVKPDGATLNSLLPAYAILADLQQGMNIHGYLVQSGFSSKVEVATSLIDIYMKSGSLDCAHRIFNDIPSVDRDIVSWSAIIAGYGMHGDGRAAISLFNQMVSSGVKPNVVTFTSALHACSHSGLVEEGLAIFKFMTEECQTNPLPDHYTCMIDLLGRAGRLGEAADLIGKMPYEPNHAIWGALLGACVIHDNVEIGEVAASRLFEIEPDNTGNYVLMAKIYAATGRWKDAEKVRHMMNEVGLKKAPAHSLIEVRNL